MRAAKLSNELSTEIVENIQHPIGRPKMFNAGAGYWSASRPVHRNRLPVQFVTAGQSTAASQDQGIGSRMQPNSARPSRHSNLPPECRAMAEMQSAHSLGWCSILPQPCTSLHTCVLLRMTGSATNKPSKSTGRSQNRNACVTAHWQRTIFRSPS